MSTGYCSLMKSGSAHKQPWCPYVVAELVVTTKITLAQLPKSKYHFQNGPLRPKEPSRSVVLIFVYTGRISPTCCNVPYSWPITFLTPSLLSLFSLLSWLGLLTPPPFHSPPPLHACTNASLSPWYNHHITSLPDATQLPPASTMSILFYGLG